jgi:hypothetical protein
MRTMGIILKWVGLAALAIVIFLIVTRISSHHSLTIDILGSYFPSWMICIVSGLGLTLIAHWLVQFGGLNEYIGPGPLVYSSLMIIFTFATWLLFYQN